jgi:hypothetical protein
MLVDMASPTEERQPDHTGFREAWRAEREKAKAEWEKPKAEDIINALAVLVAIGIVATLFVIGWDHITAWAEWLAERFVEGPPD